MVIDAAAGDPARDWVAARAFTTVEAWFAAEDGARSAAATLATIAGCVVLGIRREVPRDWEAEFRAVHQPIVVPDFGTILPPWSDAPPTPGSVIIDPGAGFGTGLHATTRLCLAAVAAACPSGGPLPRRVLDFGAGSGILGIAAAVRGAMVVDAVEIDDGIHAAILHNADLNRVRSRVRVVAGLDAPGPDERYDLVLANIVAPVLVAHAAFLAACLRPGGALVLSGLMVGDVGDVVARYCQLLGVQPTRTEADGWHCLRFDVG
jgi:ribosomal protein L11 methyltransferase